MPSTEKNNFSIYFSSRLESLMNSRVSGRWTQTELAEKIGVTQATVQKWLRDGMMPRSVELLKLSQVFGVTMESLLRPENTGTAKTETKGNR